MLPLFENWISEVGSCPSLQVERFSATVEAPRFARRKSVICDALRAKLARGRACRMVSLAG